MFLSLLVIYSISFYLSIIKRAPSTMEEDQEYKQYEIKEGIVFLIELSQTLFDPDPNLNGQCQLFELLSAIDELMSEMIITFPKNGVGVYFYHTPQTSKKFPKDCGLAKLFSLNDLNSSNMKKLSETVRDHLDGFSPLPSSFPMDHSEKDNLHTILRTILREFQAKTHYNIKKLFWFTANEKPYSNPDLKDSLRTLLTDYDDNGIRVTPVFLGAPGPSSSGSDFDVSLYRNIFLNTNFLNNALGQHRKNEYSQDNGTMAMATLLTEIRNLVIRLKHVNRIQFACDLVLSDGPAVAGSLGCSVKGYSLYNHETIRLFRQVYTEADSLKLVHTQSEYVRGDNGDVVDLAPGELNSAIDSIEEKRRQQSVFKGVLVRGSESNEKIVFMNDHALQFMKSYAFDNDAGEEEGKEKEEEEEEEKYDDNSDDNEEGETAGKTGFVSPPYLKLICFRKLHTFTPHLILKAPLFVTADLNDGLRSANRPGGYAKSLDTMKALYRSCVRLKRYGVLFGCIKRNSSPGIYVLYPTRIEHSSLGLPDREFPEGFLLMRIPWLGEIRSLPDYMLGDSSGYFVKKKEDEAPTELVSIYKKLIGLLGTREAYDPSEHGNPVLEFFYRTIKLEALQMDVKDEDTSCEKNDWMVQELIRLRDGIAGDVDKQQLVHMVNLYVNEVSNAETLKREREFPKGTEEKAVKKSKPETLSEEHVIYLWKNDLWNTATVAQLREFISRYGSIRGGSRKAEMVSNIVEFLESRRGG